MSVERQHQRSVYRLRYFLKAGQQIAKDDSIQELLSICHRDIHSPQLKAIVGDTPQYLVHSLCPVAWVLDNRIQMALMGFAGCFWQLLPTIHPTLLMWG